jgi:serine/threonine protein kinase
MDKIKYCDPILAKRLETESCPEGGRGTFKVSNVCENIPYVYYTKSGKVSKDEFAESINDLYLPLTFPESIRKYYMIPICRLKEIPGKIKMETAVVEKLTSLEDAMKILTPLQVIKSYIQFVDDYLEDVSKLAPEDVWKVISTDFKPDNVMMDVSSKRLYITDFSPAYESSNGTFTMIVTDIFTLGELSTRDFNRFRKYTKLEISKLSYSICLICMISTLCYLLFCADAMTKKKLKRLYVYAYEKIDELIETVEKSKLDRLSDKTLYLLSYISNAYRKYDVSRWMLQTPFSKKPPQAKPADDPCSEFMRGINLGEATVRNPDTGRMIVTKDARGRPTTLIKKLISRCSSDSPCDKFLEEMKNSSPTLINPDTGKKINKRDARGRPTALIKKLISRCSSDLPCDKFLEEMKNSSPTLINPITGKKINKRDVRGRPTALIKKLIKQCQS